MLPISHRLTVWLSLLVVLGWPAVVLANHHHIGGSGSGSADDTDADCLVWGYVVGNGGVDAGGDAATSDAAEVADAYAIDGGGAAPAGAVLVCLEHATLFGCDCAVGPAEREGWSRGAGALVAATLMAARRRRRPAPLGRAS